MNQVVNYILLIALIVCVSLPHLADASTEWSMKSELNLESTPLDFVVSSDSKTAYILVTGKILVYSLLENRIVDFFPVDKTADKLRLGKENTFIITSSTGNNLKVFKLEQREAIDTSGLPFKGPVNAPVTVAVYSDYQCPYCARLEPLLQQVLAKYPNDVKLVNKNNPLPFHKFAKPAAIAALAANEQGKFWEFHKKEFENISALNERKIQEIAKELKLDLDQFNKKRQDPAIIKLIERDSAEAQRIGVSGTPTIYINGKLLQDRSIQGFQNAINAELKR